jgi:hypothetical protein
MIGSAKVKINDFAKKNDVESKKEPKDYKKFV